MNNAFPFAAIVGLDDMKLAMIMTAIDPKIGGVLVFGDRGTGKSTAVRGLANLLPPINSVEGCPVNSRSLDEVPSWSESTSKKIVEIRNKHGIFSDIDDFLDKILLVHLFHEFGRHAYGYKKLCLYFLH